MSDRPRVLVIGASGRVGRHVCRRLLGLGVAVRGVAHSAEGARLIAELGVGDVVWADLEQVETLSPAFEDIDRVMQITHATREPQQELNAVEAARHAGVERIVKLSADALYYDWDPPGGSEPDPGGNPIAALHGNAEARIRETGIESVMLRPTWFMSIEAAPVVAPGLAFGQFVWPAGSPGLALVHPQDVGEVAAECLVAERLPESPILLTGSEVLSPEQIAAALSAARRTPIEVHSPTIGDYEDWLEKVAGMPRQAARVIEPYVARESVPLSDATERFLGRAPLTFTQYLASERDSSNGETGVDRARRASR